MRQRGSRRRITSKQRAFTSPMATSNARLDFLPSTDRAAPGIPGLQQHHVDALGADSWPRYQATWQDWCRFRSAKSHSPWLPPDTASHSSQLTAWGLHLFARHLRPNRLPTVLQKLSRISWMHQCTRGYPVSLSKGDYTALKGVERRHATASRNKAPLSSRMLLAGRALLNFQHSHDRVLWGAAVMAWFMLWRRSEYVAINGSVSRHVVCVNDVRFLNAFDEEVTALHLVDTVQVRIRSLKADQAAKGVHLRLGRSGHPQLCPVLAAWSLLSAAAVRKAHKEEPLCSWAAGKTLSCEELANFAKRSAALCGQDPKLFSTHSFRSGGATALFRGGAPDLAIQKFGRWASDSYKLYARIDDQTILGLAPRMVSNAWCSHSGNRHATSLGWRAPIHSLMPM